MLTAVKLSRSGYGSPEEILNMRSDTVMMMLQYEKFRSDFERAYYKMNTPKE